MFREGRFERQWEKLLLSGSGPKEDANFPCPGLEFVPNGSLCQRPGRRIVSTGNGLWQVLA